MLFFVADYGQGLLISTLRSIEKEKEGSYLMAGAYYLFGIPIAWLFCFNFEFGWTGLAIGQTIAVYLMFIGCLRIFKNLDWNLQSEVIAEKLKSDSGDLSTKLMTEMVKM